MDGRWEVMGVGCGGCNRDKLVDPFTISLLPCVTVTAKKNVAGKIKAFVSE